MRICAVLTLALTLGLGVAVGTQSGKPAARATLSTTGLAGRHLARRRGSGHL